MRDVAIWGLFFATTVWGHVAMKLAVDRASGVVSAALSPFGMTAILSWGASSILWMLVLRKSPLFQASTLSALRFVLVLAAAMVMTKKVPSTNSLIGAALIAVGVWLGRE